MAYTIATVKKLSQVATAVASGNTTILTAPAVTKDILKEILVCNPNATAAGFDLYHVPSGGAAGASNQIIHNLGDGAVAAYATKAITLSTIMEPGDFLVLRNYVNPMSHTISGLEVV